MSDTVPDTGGRSAADAPPALLAVAGPVERRLRDLLAAETERWLQVDPDLGAPLDVLTRFVLNGGKRLRPAFCHWGFVGAGGDPDDPMVVDAGAAFELLHAFALVHDDVMDGSAHPARRADRAPRVRGPSTPPRLARRVPSLRRGRGHPRGRPRRRVRRPADGRRRRPPTFAVWNELQIELNVGQYLDVLGTARPGTDLATAHRIARYKSGKYTIERPLHVGAALAGRYEELEEALSAYGAPLGEAFQLRDDILGVFGDAARTGKPVGDDLREGKPTPLLATAVQWAGPADAALLDRVGAADLTDDEVAALQQVLVDSGAKDHIEATIGDLTDVALHTLERSPLHPDAVDALTDLAHYVAARDL